MESPSSALRRQAWAQTSRQWFTLEENDQQSPPQPPPLPPLHPSSSHLEQRRSIDGRCTGTIENWLLGCGQDEGSENSRLLPDESILRASYSFEDDLSLGAEATVLNVEDEGVGSCPLLLPPPKARHKGLTTSTPRQKLSEPHLDLGYSMASSGLSSSMSRTASSVSEVLQLCSEDAEDTLYQLGFGSEVPQVTARIPTRFFNFPSQLSGINFRLFLQSQLLRLRQEDPDLSLASRFRQVEVLTTMANAFYSLYSHVSRTPLQKLAPPELSLSSPSADRKTARFLASVRSEPRSPVERLKDTVSKMCLYTSSSRESPQPSPRKRSSLPDVVDLMLGNTKTELGFFEKSPGLDNEFSRSEEQASGLEEQASGFEDQASGLDDKSSGLRNQISGFEDQPPGLVDQASGLKDQASGLELEDQASGLEDQASGLKDQASGLEDQASELKDRASGLEDQASGLKDQASGLEDQASELKDQASGLEDQASGLKDQASGLEDQASGLKDQASGLELEDQASGLEDQASGLKDQASGLEDQSSDNSQGGRKAVNMGIIRDIHRDNDLALKRLTSSTYPSLTLSHWDSHTGCGRELEQIQLPDSLGAGSERVYQVDRSRTHREAQVPGQTEPAAGLKNSQFRSDQALLDSSYSPSLSPNLSPSPFPRSEQTELDSSLSPNLVCDSQEQQSLSGLIPVAMVTYDITCPQIVESVHMAPYYCQSSPPPPRSSEESAAQGAAGSEVMTVMKGGNPNPSGRMSPCRITVTGWEDDEITSCLAVTPGSTEEVQISDGQGTRKFLLSPVKPRPSGEPSSSLQQTNSFELEEVLSAGEEDSQSEPRTDRVGLLVSAGNLHKGLVVRGDSLQSDSSGYAEDDVNCCSDRQTI